MKIIQERELVKTTSYRRNFQDPTVPHEGVFNCGLSFPCDEKGEVHAGSLAPAAKKNLKESLEGKNGYLDFGVEERQSEYWTTRVGQCDCGFTLSLGGFTNTCECGADYNSSGSRLAPREQWGEETGESLSDILQIP